MAIGDELYRVIIDRNGDVLEVTGARESRKLGIDIRREKELLDEVQELQAVLEDWRPIMIETGYLQVPKTQEELAIEAAAEQRRLIQEQEQRQIERDAKQMQINETFLKSLQQLSEANNELKNTIGELINREYNENAGRNVVERNDTKRATGKGAAKPRHNSKNNGVLPAADKESAQVGADGGTA